MDARPDELATLFRLAQAIAAQHPSETLCVAYVPTTETWRCIQLSGDRMVADLGTFPGHPTSAESLEAFITRPR